jgi:hypothetical protein
MSDLQMQLILNVLWMLSTAYLWCFIVENLHHLTNGRLMPARIMKPLKYGFLVGILFTYGQYAYYEYQYKNVLTQLNMLEHEIATYTGKV